MKKITVLTGLLILMFPVHLAAKQLALMQQLEERVSEVQNQSSEEVLVSQVEQELQRAKVFIQGHIEFPASIEDQRNAGTIFGCLMPLMYSYTKLRAKDIESAHKAGAIIAQETFISKDGTVFKLEDFIEEYIDNVTIPKLAEEFLQFKNNIHEDAASLP